MAPAPRLITVTIELRYETTPDEQAVFDGDDEAARAGLDQAVLEDVAGRVDESGFAGSRFRLGMIMGSTGSSWGNRFPAEGRGLRGGDAGPLGGHVVRPRLVELRPTLPGRPVDARRPLLSCCG